MIRRRDRQCSKNYTAHLQQDIQGLPILGILSINIMKDHNYGPLSNSIYEDAPIARSRRPTFLERRPLFNDSTPILKKVPSNTYQWTSSQTYPKVKSMTVSLQLSIKDALRQQSSYPVTRQSMSQELHNSI